MSIVAHTHPFVVGVDTHARTHTLALLEPSGMLVETRTFPASAAGMKRAIRWVSQRTRADLATLWVIEGVASYGALLASLVTGAGYLVVEAPLTPLRARMGRGKSDPIDARQIAAAALPLSDDELRYPRLAAGTRQALRVVLTAREDMTKERTQKVNALTALIRVNGLGMDARRPLTAAQITEVSRWRTREESLPAQVARGEAVRLASRIQHLDVELATNMKTLTDLVTASPAAVLLEEIGIGPVTAASLYVAWSHRGRVRTESAFAALAGVNPIPASSGNITRHRVNRGGDRRLNKVLHIAAITRETHHPATREYVARRASEGRTSKETRRMIKRYLARRVYRILNAVTVPPVAT